MSEIGAAELKRDAGGLDLPLLGQIRAAVPVVAVFAIKGRVGLRPFRGGFVWSPHRLRAGARQHVLAEALELASVTTVQKFVIVNHKAYNS